MLECAPGNQTCRRSVRTFGGRSQTAGENEARSSSSASAWKAYSMSFESDVS